MKNIFGLCAVVGILVIVASSVGNMCGNLTLGQAIWQGIGGLLVYFVGDAGLGVVEGE